MKIFIPSFNRARYVFALELFPTATVVVPVSQEADYRRSNPSATIVTIPDAQDGNLGRKRNALSALGANETDGVFVLVDDDVSGLWDKQAGGAVTGPDAVNVVKALAARAKAEGAVMFGVSPTGRRPWTDGVEWAANVFFPGLYGFRSAPGVSFDEAISGFEVMDYFFQCRERDLKTLRWERYGLDVVKGNLGGLERLKTKCVEAGEAFARKWGPRAVILTPEGVVCGINPNAVKRLT